MVIARIQFVVARFGRSIQRQSAARQSTLRKPCLSADVWVCMSVVSR